MVDALRDAAAGLAGTAEDEGGHAVKATADAQDDPWENVDGSFVIV
jgi:hypothetical protein